VIIVKLPFAVPDEPVTEARLDAIKRSGGNPFMAYSVPEAIIKLKQGFGRLIRSRTDKGIVVIEALAPGRYSIQAESPGFELGFVRDVRLRAGDNKHAIVLPLKGFTDSVTVSSDGQAAASSRSGPAFGAAMTRDQLEALSDDPGELARQINDFAGPDAIIRVDSFEGAQLPPKSQIKSVHVTRDQFAAETSQSGSTFIEISTISRDGRRQISTVTSAGSASDLIFQTRAATGPRT